VIKGEVKNTIMKRKWATRIENSPQTRWDRKG
jgi:hypothetical protein